LLPISLLQLKGFPTAAHTVYDTSKCKGEAKEGRVRRKIRNQPYIFPKAPPCKAPLAARQRVSVRAGASRQEQLRDPPTLLRLAPPPPLGAEPLTAQSIRCAWTSSHLAAWAFCVGAASHLAALHPPCFHPHHRSLLPRSRSIAAMLL
jgi:hypothetical protein